MNYKNIDWKKLVGTLLVGGYLGYCLQNQQSAHIIDAFDLVIHEAGHTIFSFLGEFIHVLGGSLLQVLIPAIFSAYFCIRRDYFSASVVALWVAYNIINVSVYMSDAIRMQLPLLGGDGVLHDWNILFSKMGVLYYTPQISYVVYTIGVFLFIGALVNSLRFLKKAS
ncbi:MAG: hypothetical protein V4481_02950 [Patescibacteria group bacterium]